MFTCPFPCSAGTTTLDRRSDRRRYKLPTNKVLRPAPCGSCNVARMGLFEYVEHPHISHRKRVGAPTTDQARQKVHGSSWMGRLNNKLGLLVTVAVGSMWCAYLFSVLALLALPDAIKQGTYYVVVWLSSSFLQLVLLPIIIVGQNIQAKASDARAQATYDDASAVLDKATQIQSHLLQIQDHLESQDAQILAILTRVSETPDPAR